VQFPSAELHCTTRSASPNFFLGRHTNVNRPDGTSVERRPDTFITTQAAIMGTMQETEIPT
jgi:hypothetical protein